MINLAYKRVPKPNPIDFRVVETLKGRNYRLTGMVMLRARHYSAIVYVPEKGWFNFNDEKVRSIGDEPSPQNLGDSRNVPVLFFYTLENVGGPQKEKRKNHNNSIKFFPSSLQLIF